MKYVGIQTQISRNNTKTILLLLLFPVIILGMVWVFLALLNYFGGGYYNQYGDMVNQLNVAEVNAIFLRTIPWVIIGVGLWFTFAYFSNARMVKAATGARSLERKDRQLPYLRQLNRRHRLLVVFFADTDLAQVIADPAESADDYARRLAAEQMEYEKQMIVSHLSQQGIYSLLSAPQSLTVDVINKYIDMKRINILS